MQLNPSPDTMGLGAPVLGPWFTDDTLVLQAPDQHLTIPIRFGDDAWWLAPVAGHVVARFATLTPDNRRARGIDRLRRPDGRWAFHALPDHVVVALELLPQVRVRLAELQNNLPSADAFGSHGRYAIRWLTLDWPRTTDDDLARELDLRHPDAVSAPDVVETLAHYGLRPGGENHDPAGVRLVRPGVALPAPTSLTPGVPRIRDRIVRMRSNVTYTLRAFDDAGRAVDPGAVADWWQYIADNDPSTSLPTDPRNRNLWAPNVAQRTCDVVPQILIHLVNAHEGPVNPDVLQRLGDGDGVLGQTLMPGAPQFRTVTGENPLIFAPSDAVPLWEDLRAPSIALARLPGGAYDGRQLLQGNTLPPLARDYVRVAAISREYHLTGARRDGTKPVEEVASRADHFQSVGHLRVQIERTRAPTLLVGVDEIHGAALTVLRNGAGAGWVFTQAIDPDWCAWPVPADFVDLDPPSDRPTLRARALAGQGEDDNGVIVRQTILVEVDLPVALVGAWVRLWIRRTDLETGLHVRLAGGAGRALDPAPVDPTSGVARAYIVLTLPDGSGSPDGDLSFDGQVVTARGERLFSELRVSRPALIPGNDAALGTGPLVVAELGQLFEPSTPPTGVPPDAGLVVLSDPPALLDGSTLVGVVADAWRTVATAATNVVVTSPPYDGSPEGTTDDTLLAPASVQRRNRSATTDLQGKPAFGQHRLEQIVVGAGPVAVVGGVESRAGLHQRTAAPAGAATAPLANRSPQGVHAFGHPGVPAGGERGAVGARLTDLAAVDVLERTLASRATTTTDVPTVLSETLPNLSGLTDAGPWSAVLRTTAPGLTGGAIGSMALQPFELPWSDDVERWALDAGFPVFPGLAPEIIERLERLFLEATWGAQQALVSLLAAVQRAEDLIYLETSALDAAPLRSGKSLFAAIRDRLIENPNLGLVVCIAANPAPGTPRMARQIHDALFRRAWSTVDVSPKGWGTRLSEQVAFFSPRSGPGRALRLPTSAVVIDDAYAFVGNTPLSRRGLTYDSSFGVAVFDDRLIGRRPREVVEFRRTLLQQRLGLEITAIPDGGRELADLVRGLHRAGGHGRLANPGLLPDLGTSEVPRPSPQGATTSEQMTLSDRWNPDGLPVPLVDIPNGLVVNALPALSPADDSLAADRLDLEDP